MSEGDGQIRPRRRASRLGLTRARNSRGDRERCDAERTAVEDVVDVVDVVDPPTAPMVTRAPRDAEPAPYAESTRTRVRPYVRTRGRTRTRADLAVETLVSIPSPRPPMDDPEHLAVGDVCTDPRSVAEVAALLAVPLGVARVLIDDMAGAGLIIVHPRAATGAAPPSMDILQRVLDGLHRL